MALLWPDYSVLSAERAAGVGGWGRLLPCFFRGPSPHPYLLLKGSGDQAPQFRKAAVDAVPAPFLYDLKSNEERNKNQVGTSSQFPTCFDGH